MDILKQSTAVTIVMGPMLDDADGNTPETALAIAQADIRLSKNGGAYAQSNNAAGATHMEVGKYSVPLDTTDTATLGKLRVDIHESGALAVWREFTIVPANKYDSLVLGTDVLHADMTQCGGSAVAAGAIPNAAADAAGGLPVSDVGGLDLDTKLANTNEITAARMGALTDWGDGGRLDLILDIIASDVDTILDGATLLLSSTISSVNSQTSLRVLGGSIYANSYRDQIVVIYDVSVSNEPSVRRITGSSYDGYTVISLDSAPDYTVVAGDIVKIFAANTASVPDVGEIRTEMEGAGYYLDLIKADTNELQTDWADGGRLDLLLDAIPTTAMRGTDSATLAATWTDARAGYLDNLSAGAVALDSGVDVTSIHGAALTETVNGYLAASFTKLFDVVTPLLVASEVMRGTDSAALAATALTDATWTDARAGYIDELAAANLPTDISNVKTDTAAILTDTGTDGVVVAAASKTGYALSNAGVDAILDEIIEGTHSMRELMRLFAAMLVGKVSGGGTATITFRDIDDTKDRIVMTVTDVGNRTALVLTES